MSIWNGFEAKEKCGDILVNISTFKVHRTKLQSAYMNLVIFESVVHFYISSDALLELQMLSARLRIIT